MYVEKVAGVRQHFSFSPPNPVRMRWGQGCHPLASSELKETLRKPVNDILPIIQALKTLFHLMPFSLACPAHNPSGNLISIFKTYPVSDHPPPPPSLPPQDPSPSSLTCVIAKAPPISLSRHLLLESITQKSVQSVKTRQSILLSCSKPSWPPLHSEQSRNLHKPYRT